MSNYFTDRVVQHPGRITLTPTGGSDEYDVDRAEGTVNTPGTPFNAESMNGAIDLYGFYYGTSSTAASTAAKVVTCTGFTLVTGAKIAVKFTYANTYEGQITLNVNGTGAKSVYDYGQYYDGQTRCAWDANETKVFVYDGTRWNLVNGDIITDASLDALETALGISSYTANRLYNILDALADRPYITEQGWDSSWRYRKWSNGFVEAWRAGVNFGSVTPQVWVSPVRFAKPTPVSIPAGIFSAAPTVIAQSKTSQWWPVFMTASSATSIDDGRFATLASSAQTLTVSLYCFGS